LATCGHGLQRSSDEINNEHLQNIRRPPVRRTGGDQLEREVNVVNVAKPSTPLDDGLVVVWQLCLVLECANAPGMDDECEALARLGRCDTDRSLLDTCKLSCTRCAPIPSNVSGTLVVVT